MSLLCYVGGPSAQLGRVLLAARRLEEAGVVVPCKWWLDVEARGGRPDSELTLSQQLSRAMADWRHVREAHVVWILWPDAGVTSHGAAAELGYACGLDIDWQRVIVSGTNVGACIFTSTVTRFISDSEALDDVLAHASQQDAVEIS